MWILFFFGVWGDDVTSWRNKSPPSGLTDKVFSSPLPHPATHIVAVKVYDLSVCLWPSADISVLIAMTLLNTTSYLLTGWAQSPHHIQIPSFSYSHYQTHHQCLDPGGFPITSHRLTQWNHNGVYSQKTHISLFLSLPLFSLLTLFLFHMTEKVYLLTQNEVCSLKDISNAQIGSDVIRIQMFA